MAQLVMNPPAMQETPVRFLGWEDLWEKGLGYPPQYSLASLVAQLVKNPPAMQETPVQFRKIHTGERIGYPLQYSLASLVAQLVKILPAMRDTWVQSLDWEDPLEKGSATHSTILGLPLLLSW